MLFLSLRAFLLPLLGEGVVQTHDGENHLARFAQYYLALRQGQFPPRVAPYMMGGYGYPVFNYNYPLPNILAIPFTSFDISIEFTFKLLMFVSIVFGARGVFVFFRQHTTKEVASFGVLSFILAPFLYSDFFARGVIGEMMAYAIFPHLFLSFDLFLKKQTVARFLYVHAMVLSLLLSHNIFVLYLVPLFAAYWIVRMYQAKWNAFFLYAIPYLLAGLSACFFWIPAMFEQGFVVMKYVNLTQFYSSHFPTMLQLFSSPFDRGFSYEGPVDALSFSLGLLTIVSIPLFFAQLVFMRNNKKPYFSIFVLSLLILFLMQPISLFIWKAFPLLQFTQFPWRLIGIFALCFLPLQVMVYHKASSNLKLFLLGVSFLMVLSLTRIQNLPRIHHNNAYYFSFAETSTVQHENQPVTLTEVPQDLSSQYPILKSGEVLEIKKWNGSYHRYTVRMFEDGLVTEPTAFFHGWETKINGKKIEIEHQKSGGLISFSVPVGEHEIESRFTQNTPARLIGNSLSVIGVIGVGIFSICIKKKYA
ncbi:MAG: hypothetical protein A2378_01975 [Candidatus Pacebacteria bacterium RIFOXYB1_FULL_44_10]|nr:MAG: hypothetical protein A2378_01975 [Candidatus Pacebacteria bacterium RIFOXYB1_FULL_44_10]